MFRHIPDGVFEFKVDVHDKHFNETKTSVVKVSMMMTSETAVYNSGSLLVSGK